MVLAYLKIISLRQTEGCDTRMKCVVVVVVVCVCERTRIGRYVGMT